MQPEEILDALKGSISQHTKRLATESKTNDEQAFCEYNGVITVRIADKLGLGSCEARRALEKLVKEGKVLKSSDNKGRYCRWWPVGHLHDLRCHNA